MVHRHDLHTALNERIVSAEGPGRPVKVHLGTRVTICDPESGSLVTADGATHTADLLIGADGIKVSTQSLTLPGGSRAEAMMVTT